MRDHTIILTGFMGSGKSSVGRILAQKLSYRFVDLDYEIESASGCSINDIFAGSGEDVFRALENKHLERALTDGEETVIATGGGAIIAEHNRLMMQNSGVIVNLKVSLAQVLTRLHGCSNRPLLAGEDVLERIRTLMAAREHFYADADIQIDTNGKSVEDVSMEILRSLNRLSG